VSPTDSYPRWLHRLAVATALVTLALIGLGGMVTSKEAGMAVPDWPTTFGENMFLFPFSQWIGGVFFEHSHRLLASAVGMLTVALASWIWVREMGGVGKWVGLAWIVAGMGLIGVRQQVVFIVLALVSALVLVSCFFRMMGTGRKIAWWAMIAYCLVLVQGTLGGLRVTLYRDEIGIVHGTIAQLFFLLICSIALVTGQGWRRILAISENPGIAEMRPILALMTGLILCQLVLGASMRHQHAGLAVPDFPLAYGRIWPATDGKSILEANRKRLDPREFKPITANHVRLHMAHRLLAVGILGGLAWCCLVARRRTGAGSAVVRATDIWLGLICVQAILGAATIWSQKSAEVATLHVMTGAVCLTFGGLLTISVFRVSKPLCVVHKAAHVPDRSPVGVSSQ
jgi:cytochrome c oxidase assembly protein subunit 15